MKVTRIMDDELKSSIIKVIGNAPWICGLIYPNPLIKKTAQTKLAVLNMYVKSANDHFSFDVVALDKRNHKISFKICTYVRKLQVTGEIVRIPLTLVKGGWNFISIDVRDYLRKFFKSDFSVIVKVKIYPSVLIRKVFLSDDVYELLELPDELQLCLVKAKQRRLYNPPAHLKPVRGKIRVPRTPASSPTPEALECKRKYKSHPRIEVNRVIFHADEYEEKADIKVRNDNNDDTLTIKPNIKSIAYLSTAPKSTRTNVSKLKQIQKLDVGNFQQNLKEQMLELEKKINLLSTTDMSSMINKEYSRAKQEFSKTYLEHVANLDSSKQYPRRSKKSTFFGAKNITKKPSDKRITEKTSRVTFSDQLNDTLNEETNMLETSSVTTNSNSSYMQSGEANDNGKKFTFEHMNILCKSESLDKSIGAYKSQESFKQDTFCNSEDDLSDYMRHGGGDFSEYADMEADSSVNYSADEPLFSASKQIDYDDNKNMMAIVPVNEYAKKLEKLNMVHDGVDYEISSKSQVSYCHSERNLNSSNSFRNNSHAFIDDSNVDSFDMDNEKDDTEIIQISMGAGLISEQ